MKKSIEIYSFLIATAIVFCVMIVGFFSYVGYRVSYSMALSDTAKIIKRELNKINDQVYMEVKVRMEAQSKSVMAMHEARYGLMD